MISLSNPTPVFGHDLEVLDNIRLERCKREPVFVFRRQIVC